MEIKLLLLMIFSSLAASVDAFMARPTFGSVPIVSRTILSAVIEIGSEAAFDKKIKSSGSALVIVDYSTTWCGPCKGAFVTSTRRCGARIPWICPCCYSSFLLFCSSNCIVIAPKFEELSDKYPDAVFLKGNW